MSPNIAGPFFAVTYNLPPLVNVGGLKDRYLKLGSSNSFTQTFIEEFQTDHATLEAGDFNKNTSFYTYDGVIIPVDKSSDIIEDTDVYLFYTSNVKNDLGTQYNATNDITDNEFNKKYLIMYARDKLRVNNNIALTTNLISQNEIISINPDNSYTFNVHNGQNDRYDLTVSTFNHHIDKTNYLKHNIRATKYLSETDQVFKDMVEDTPIHYRRLRFEAVPPKLTGTLLHTYDFISDSLNDIELKLQETTLFKLKRNVVYSNTINTTSNVNLNIRKATHLYTIQYANMNDGIKYDLSTQELNENHTVYLRYFTCNMTLSNLKVEFTKNTKNLKPNLNHTTIPETGASAWVYNMSATVNAGRSLILDQSKSVLIDGKDYNADYFDDASITITETFIRRILGTGYEYKDFSLGQYTNQMLMETPTEPRFIFLTTDRDVDSNGNKEVLVFQLVAHPDNHIDNLISFSYPNTEFVEFQLPPKNATYIYLDMSSNENTAIYDMNSNEIEAQFENKIENSSVVTKFNSLTAPYSKMIEEGNDTNRINSQFVTGTKDYNFVPKQTQIVSSPFDKDFELELNTKVSDIRLQLNFTPIDSQETPMKMF
jgi:hypothetical protein